MITQEQLDEERIPNEFKQLNFWDRAVETDSGCWELVPRYQNPSISIKDGKRKTTVQLARLLTNVPKGLLVYHTCDSKYCFRPSHVFTRTHEEKHELRMRKWNPDSPYLRKDS